MPQEVKPAFLPQSQNRNTGFFNFGGGGGAGGGGFSGILGSAIKTFADEGINMAKELAFGPTEQELAAQLANRDTQYTGAKQGFSKGLSVDQVKALYPDLEDDQLAALANDVQIQTLGYQAGKQKDDLQAAQSQRQKVKMAPVVAGGSAAGSAIGEQVSAPVSAESKANVAQMEDTQTGLDKSLEYAPSETTDLISPTGEPMGMGTNQIADQTSSIVFSGDPAHPEFQTAMGEISNRLKESPDRVKLASSADANLADYLDFRLQTSQMRNHDMYTAVFNKSFTPDNNIAAYDARDAVDLEVWGNYLDTKLSALGIVPDLVAQAPFAPMVEFISQQNNPANLQTLEATAISMKQMAETPEQEAEAQKMLDSVDESRRRAEEGRKYIASLNGRDAAQTIAFFSSKPFSDIAMGKNSNASVNQLARIATNWQTIQGRKAVAEMQEGHKDTRAQMADDTRRAGLALRERKEANAQEYRKAVLAQNLSDSNRKFALRQLQLDIQKDGQDQRNEIAVMNSVAGIRKSQAQMFNTQLQTLEKQKAGIQSSSGKMLPTAANKEMYSKQLSEIDARIAAAKLKFEEANQGLTELQTKGYDAPPAIFRKGSPEYYENVMGVDMSALSPDEGLLWAKKIDKMAGPGAAPLGTFKQYLDSQPGLTDEKKQTLLNMYKEGLNTNGVVSK